MKEYFAYVFRRLIEGEKDYEKLLPVLLHGKFKQTKVKTIIINGFPAPVYMGLDAIECLQSKMLGMNKNNCMSVVGAEKSLLSRVCPNLTANRRIS